MIVIEDLRCPLCGIAVPEIVDEYPDSEEQGLHPLSTARCEECGHSGNVGAFLKEVQ